MLQRLTSVARAKQFFPNRRKVLNLAVLLVAAVALANAQAPPAETPDSSSHGTKIDPHVFEFNVEAGWAFRLPDAHVTIGPPEGTTATARLKTTQMAPSAGIRFWATRWVGVSVDVLGVNSGSASAQLSGEGVTVGQHFVAVYVGAEAQRARGPIQAYVHFGGGPLRVWNQTDRLSRAVTAGSLRTGGGLRLMCSPRWGVKFGAEVLHYSANDIGAHTFGRVTAGLFFRTLGRPAQ